MGVMITFQNNYRCFLKDNSPFSVNRRSRPTTSKYAILRTEFVLVEGKTQ
jgi:hypothetical protein